MKKCDKILERLFAHVRKSILAEMESKDNAEIARLRQTCEEYVHTQLGNIPIELVRNNQNLASHAKEYSDRMIPKLTGMVEEVREAFEPGTTFGNCVRCVRRNCFEPNLRREQRWRYVNGH